MITVQTNMLSFTMSISLFSKIGYMTSIIFEIKDHKDRTLINAEIFSKKGIVALLGCFEHSIDNRISHLRELKKKEWKEIIVIKGKTGEEHEQLLDKPDGEDELAMLASHFNLNSVEDDVKDVWDTIRETGFHELLPA